MEGLQRTLRIAGGDQVSIRPARGSDASKIISCINQVGSEKIYIVIERFAHTVEWEQSYIEGLNPENILYLVCEIGTEIIGMLSIERENYPKMNHTATLGMIILKKYRKAGIGSAMLNEAFEWAKMKNIRKICLSCFSTNRAAIALYRKFNFEEEGRRRGQFIVDGKYVDEVMMARWV
jgi:RimJ/RimL family protein N-acetyltransferase